MNFELGKEYIVRVTEKGIIPIDEFDSVRFFDKDTDDLDFLTDEEKTVIINRTLNEVKTTIETDLSWSMFDEYGNETRIHRDLMEILDNIGETESQKLADGVGFLNQSLEDAIDCS